MLRVVSIESREVAARKSSGSRRGRNGSRARRARRLFLLMLNVLGKLMGNAKQPCILAFPPWNCMISASSLFGIWRSCSC